MIHNTEDEKIGDDISLEKCPRCGCEVYETPYPGLMAFTTVYSCGTKVITVTGGGGPQESFLDFKGIHCHQK